MLIRQVHKKKYIISHYLTFLDKGFKFQEDVCNWYHDVLMIPTKLSNIAILSINDVDFRFAVKGTARSFHQKNGKKYHS